MTVAARYRDNLGGYVDLYFSEYRQNPFGWMDTQFTYYNWQSELPEFYGDWNEDLANPYPNLVSFIEDKLGQGSYAKIVEECERKSFDESAFVTVLCGVLLEKAKIFALPIMFGYYSEDIFYYIQGADLTYGVQGTLVGFAWVNRDELTYKGEPVERLTEQRVKYLVNHANIALQVYNAYLNGKVYDVYVYDRDGNEIASEKDLYDYGYEFDFLDEVYKSYNSIVPMDFKLEFTKIEV